ncbi:hypothetical protein DYL61_21070 [Pseudomonas nabeulensis]|uniref:Uncharacterized protein n=1 Tax=Pseudomonas nabeulensis TaxID=2293833 RepID=A0A4Z0ATK1_9PSED|nr:hypothetical protein DYL61_21070 [Pseudomonas nabeulensis]
MWERLLWRGSLLPLGCEAPPTAGDCCAVEREQAPSPQQARSHRDRGVFVRVITGMSSAYRPWAMALSISQFSEGPRSLVTSTGRPA